MPCRNLRIYRILFIRLVRWLMCRVPDTRIQLDQTKTISEHSCADEKTWLGL